MTDLPASLTLAVQDGYEASGVFVTDSMPIISVADLPDEGLTVDGSCVSQGSPKIRYASLAITADAVFSDGRGHADFIAVQGWSPLEAV